ncbi:DNA repair exonuclease [Paenibacillus sp. PL2-23]|uniref:metallophosphoesterase family protein n=1 Tax=Paenibacillus sp. PL2-23 TaxID=2100729 RepID=UPI0030F5345F
MCALGISFRFLHAADLHLDSPFRGLSKAPEAVREQLEASTFEAVRRLTEAAIEERVDFIVIAGDLYDSADRSLRAQLALVREWERLREAGVAVYAIHGNHDHLGGDRAQLDLPSNVHIFGAGQVDCQPAFSRTGELAAHIYGMSYGQRAEMRNMAAHYRPLAGAPYHIALLHGHAGGDAGHDPYAPCTVQELAASGFHYWALGHIHKRGVLHEYPHIVYPGNIQGRNPKETGPKGCFLVEVSEEGRTELQFVPLDSVRWTERSVSIEGHTTEQELLRELRQAAAAVREEQHGRAVMLRLKLIGRGSLYRTTAQQATLAALLEELQAEEEPMPGAPWLYCYALTAETGAVIDWDTLAGEDSFAGELLRLSERLLSSEGDWRAFASAALEDARLHPKLGRIGREKWERPPAEWLQEARELALGMIVQGGSSRREG